MHLQFWENLPAQFKISPRILSNVEKRVLTIRNEAVPHPLKARGPIAKAYGNQLTDNYHHDHGSDGGLP